MTLFLEQIPTVSIVLVLFVIAAVILFLGMIGLIILLISRAAKRRTYDRDRGREMEQTALQLGFNFRSTAQLAELSFLSAYQAFEGNAIGAENLLTRNVKGDDVAIFDLVLRSSGLDVGTGSITSRQTMLLVGSVRLQLPEFYLRPEGFSEKILPEFTRIDIDFPSNPAFSDRCLLYGSDESAIRSLFSADKLSFFETNPHLCVYGAGRLLSLHYPKVVLPPESLEKYLGILAHLQQMFGH